MAHEPTAVRVLQSNACAAGRGSLAAVEINGFHFIVCDDNELPFSSRLLGQLHVHDRDWPVEHADFLNDDGVDRINTCRRLSINGLEDNASVSCDEEDIHGLPVLEVHLRINHYFGEAVLEEGLDEERAPEEAGDSFVHERVVLGEVDVELRQSLAVGHTTSWSWLRHLGRVHWEPVGVECLLLLEGPLEGIQDGPHGEGADGGPRDGVRRRREHGVDDLVALAAVDARDDVRRRLDLIEVEGISPRNGAVESALQEGRPGVLQALRAASPVALAHARDPRVHALPAVHVFDGGFAEEEEHEVAVVEGVHEVRSIELFVVIVVRFQGLPEDKWNRSLEVRYGARVQLAINIDVSGVVSGIVGTLAGAVRLREVETPVRLLSVVATQRLIRVGAADEELSVALLGQDPDVVLAVGHRLALVEAHGTILIRGVPNYSLTVVFLQVMNADIIDDVPGPDEEGIPVSL